MVCGVTVQFASGWTKSNVRASSAPDRTVSSCASELVPLRKTLTPAGFGNATTLGCHTEVSEDLNAVGPSEPVSG